MKNFIYNLKLFFEKIDGFRDKALFVVIKPYWPRKILPNHLTIIRIIIGLALFVLLFYYKDTSETLIISLFLVGALTDLFDGSVARGLDMETYLGARMDPVADRFLVAPVAISSLLFVHPWLLLWLCLLEIINMLVSVYAHYQNLLIKHNIFWKIKFFMYAVVFIAILLFWPTPPNPFFISILWFSTIFGVISIFLRIKEVYEIK